MSAKAPHVQRSLCDGATILTLNEPSFPLVRFVIALRYGASHDATGRSGTLRLLFELFLRGTKRADRRTFNATLEALGSSVDTSVGHELALIQGVTLKRHLDATLNLVCEALLTPALATHEFGRLVEETIEELRVERDEDETAADYFLRRSLYPHHPLGRCAAGEIADLQALTHQSVCDVYRSLCAENLIIAMAGAVSHEQVVQLAAPLINGLQKSPAQQPIGLPQVSEPEGLQIIVVDKPDRTQTQLRLARLGPAAAASDVETFWLGIMAFGGTFTSPLTREVRDERGWSYVAHADFRRRARFASPLILRTAPALADAIECLALKLELYQDLARGKMVDGALDLARSYVLNRYPFEIATAFDMLAPVLSCELLGQPIERIFAFPERLQAIDLRDVPQVMQRHLHPDNVIALLVGPKNQLIKPLKKRFPHATIKAVDFREGLGLNFDA